ncbi:hypothetical protein EIP91_007244 [Steccherinum ochraceum]|uniref:Uncharacterized protein n=1 Tax=Steccherinum ochraceum TaxID=92696 RepID=A0A4R0R6W4_9APHY|nr:hypothetical protein EIP91_007244 [Steccherinum ochraceum]
MRNPAGYQLFQAVAIRWTGFSPDLAHDIDAFIKFLNSATVSSRDGLSNIVKELSLRGPPSSNGQIISTSAADVQLLLSGLPCVHTLKIYDLRLLYNRPSSPTLCSSPFKLQRLRMIGTTILTPPWSGTNLSSKASPFFSLFSNIVDLHLDRVVLRRDLAAKPDYESLRPTESNTMRRTAHVKNLVCSSLRIALPGNIAHNQVVKINFMDFLSYPSSLPKEIVDIVDVCGDWETLHCKLEGDGQDVPDLYLAVQSDHGRSEHSLQSTSTTERSKHLTCMRLTVGLCSGKRGFARALQAIRCADASVSRIVVNWVCFTPTQVKVRSHLEHADTWLRVLHLRKGLGELQGDDCKQSWAELDEHLCSRRNLEQFEMHFSQYDATGDEVVDRNPSRPPMDHKRDVQPLMQKLPGFGAMHSKSLVVQDHIKY